MKIQGRVKQKCKVNSLLSSFYLVNQVKSSMVKIKKKRRQIEGWVQSTRLSKAFYFALDNSASNFKVRICSNTRLFLTFLCMTASAGAAEGILVDIHKSFPFLQKQKQTIIRCCILFFIIRSDKCVCCCESENYASRSHISAPRYLCLSLFLSFSVLFSLL